MLTNFSESLELSRRPYTPLFLERKNIVFSICLICEKFRIPQAKRQSRKPLKLFFDRERINMDNIRISTVQFENKSGDKTYNLDVISKLAGEASRQGAQAVAFHECSITGYTF